MGRVGGRRTLQTYTRGVLEVNSECLIWNFLNFFCEKLRYEHHTVNVSKVCGG